MVLDGEETPYQKLLLDRKSKRVVLFSSDKVEHHRIRVVKLTENFRTAVAVHSLICDGELSKPELRNRPTIEFIGDSSPVALEIWPRMETGSFLQRMRMPG